jgi:signal transduction histidine kinase
MQADNAQQLAQALQKIESLEQLVAQQRRELDLCASQDLERGHAQKLESVGRLAAGIAHEINTPIQFIGDSVYFLRDAIVTLVQLLEKYRTLTAEGLITIPEEILVSIIHAEEEADVSYLIDHVPGAIDRALEGVRRVAGIVQAMREFAHPDQVEMSPADINRALRSTLEVTRNEYKYVAEVESEFGEIPYVVCHIGDLNQVFLNLLVNASHAIYDVVKDSGDKGLIRVKTRQEGDAVVIEISDSGCGIPRELYDKIFDPFFTTKEVGRGTGQGLAIARNIVVEKHRGALTFQSQPGQGTTFFIRLPLDCRNSAPS